MQQQEDTNSLPSQKFSFKHDLRAVDHSPNYAAKYDGNEQQWQERLQLTYNRLLPYQFSYYDNNTFEFRQTSTLRIRTHG